MSVTVRIEMITPKKAAEWLEHNTRNRPLRIHPRVKKMARDMEAGAWHLTHQGVAFCGDGSLADGQHRLSAIVLSGIPCKMVVARGLSRGAMLVLDDGGKRTPAQNIRLSSVDGYWINEKVVPIANCMCMVEGGPVASSMTTREILEYAENHGDAIQFSLSAFPANKKGISTAIVKAAVACAYYYEKSSRLGEFCEVMVSGMPEGKKDAAAIGLRDWLLSSSANYIGANRPPAMKRTMTAINDFCEGRKYSRVNKSDDYLYSPNP